MATLAASGVTVSRSWFMGLKKDVLLKEVSVVLSSMGTATNYLPASAFGFARFVGPAHFTKSDNSVVLVGVPSYDGTKLLLKAADTNAPADYSGTFAGVVSGR